MSFSTSSLIVSEEVAGTCWRIAAHCFTRWHRYPSRQILLSNHIPPMQKLVRVTGNIESRWERKAHPSAPFFIGEGPARRADWEDGGDGRRGEPRAPARREAPRIAGRVVWRESGAAVRPDGRRGRYGCRPARRGPARPLEQKGGATPPGRARPRAGGPRAQRAQ